MICHLSLRFVNLYLTRLHIFDEILINFVTKLQALMLNSSIQSFGSVPSSYNTFPSQNIFQPAILSTMPNQTSRQTFVELLANASPGNAGATTVVNSQNQQHILMKEGRENILQGHGRVQAVPKDNGQSGWAGAGFGGF